MGRRFLSAQDSFLIAVWWSREQDLARRHRGGDIFKVSVRNRVDLFDIR